MTQSPGEVDAAVLARLIGERGLVPMEELETALQQWRREAASPGATGGAAGAAGGFDAWLVRHGVLTAGQLQRVKHDQETDTTLAIPGYQILERLGAGAAATVYKAKQLRLDRLVALKVLHRKASSDPAKNQKLIAEARAAAALNHPNVVQAYDVGQAGDLQYFVMEYVQGTTVAQVLARQKKYEEKQALAIVAQVADALRHAHAKGLVHCDIKPQNIILTAGGAAKLADLGLARRALGDGGAGQGGNPFGTPHYISPEQVRGGADLDGRTDIYSLGCTLYHMVTGRVPFEGLSAGDVMRQHLFSKPTPPEQVNPQLSDETAAILAMMLAKEPAQRYPSVEHLLQDLTAAQRGKALVHAAQDLKLGSLIKVEEKGEIIPAPRRQYLNDWLFWALMLSLGFNVLLLLRAMLR